MDGDRPFWRSGSVVLSLGVLVVVVGLHILLRQLGGTPAPFTLFLGRFHPLAVHLPIGIVLLVGAAEVATLSPRFRDRLDPAIGLALVPLVVVTAGTFFFGHLLVRSGDFAPRLLASHRQAEFFAAVGICLFPLAWAYQRERATPRARGVYRALLGLTLFSLTAGAHFGGTLTHGDGYLTHYAPAPLRALLGVREPKPAASASPQALPQEPRLFANVVQPLLVERCASCHGAEKAKAGLRLDSLDAILKGGESGVVVTPRAPDDSELLRRVLLPVDDDDHMPPEDKPGLSPAEIALLRFWIERGADDHLLVRDLLLPAEAKKALEAIPSQHAAPAASAPSGAPPASSTGAPAPSSTAPAASANTPTSTLPPTATTPEASSSASEVLRDKCEKCHGASKQKSKLRVDSLDALLTGGKSGPAIVAGSPSSSELLRRLSLPVGDEKHMPPAKESQLTPSEVATIAAFIRNLSPSGHAPQRAAPAAPSSPGAAPPLAPAGDPSPPAAAPPPDSPAPARSPEPADPVLVAHLPARVDLYGSAIAPLLHSHCEQCHSGSSPAGGLAMQPHAALLRGGNSAAGVVPGKPSDSILVTRISLPLDDGDHMPPEGETQLSADDIALVVAWVERGASERGEVETRTLPGAAVRALAARPPANAPAAPAEEHRAAIAPRRSGGCAACSIPERRRSPSAGPWLAGVVGAALLCRRAGAKPLKLMKRPLDRA